MRHAGIWPACIWSGPLCFFPLYMGFSISDVSSLQRMVAFFHLVDPFSNSIDSTKIILQHKSNYCELSTPCLQNPHTSLSSYSRLENHQEQPNFPEQCLFLSVVKMLNTVTEPLHCFIKRNVTFRSNLSYNFNSIILPLNSLLSGSKDQLNPSTFT